MNPGPVEEAGQTARTIIDALKSYPMILTFIIFNVLFIGGVLFWGYSQRSFAHTEQLALHEAQAKIADMLYHCTPTK